MATQLAHRMHVPTEEPLPDLGFRALPELGLANAWVSEYIFLCLFVPFLAWTFSPFVAPARARFYTAVLWARLLAVLCACQALRIISFTVTQLPAPNYHCRAAEETAVREMPDKWWGHVAVDLGRQTTHGCGDLVFSSHTTFVLVGVLTYTEYGGSRALKLVGWLGAAAMALAIVASRKHYSVDVVVAWYVVPLVFYAMLRRWTTKRPAADFWPHRPLAGEEGAEAGGAVGVLLEHGAPLGGGELEARPEGGKPPLLPVVTLGPGGAAHARTPSAGRALGAAAAGAGADLRGALAAALSLGGGGGAKPGGAGPPRDKGPASPPPGAAEAAARPLRAPGGAAAGRRTRQNSSLGGASELAGDARDLEGGSGGDSPPARRPLLGGGAPGAPAPAEPEATCAIM
jgi:hypothetical protein